MTSSHPNRPLAGSDTVNKELQRMTMTRRKKKWLTLSLGLVVLFPVCLYLVFPNTSQLIVALVTQTLPNPDHLTRIRNNLLDQDNFVAMLTDHEKIALRRFNATGDTLFVKKYIHKTPTSMFDLNRLHDLWEVWVRTDIVEGRPLTSFLVRLGLIKDTQAETFFSGQCTSEICRSLLRSALNIYNKMFDWGIFKPIRLNITESDETSSICRKRISLNEWHQMVHQLHKQKKGVGFIHMSHLPAGGAATYRSGAENCQIPESISTFDILVLNAEYHFSRPSFWASRCSLFLFQFLMESKSAQYETVIPTSCRADSTPRNPGCLAASSTIFAAISL
jgi:hypothetical protein